MEGMFQEGVNFLESVCVCFLSRTRICSGGGGVVKL